MTIYMLQWKEKDTGNKHTHVCSSYSKAQAALKALNKNSNCIAESNPDGNIITQHKLSSQADVINLINNLDGTTGSL